MISILSNLIYKELFIQRKKHPSSAARCLFCGYENLNGGTAFFPGADRQCAAAHQFKTFADVIQRDMRLVIIRGLETGAGILYNEYW